jgi:hypothetical protein
LPLRNFVACVPLKDGEGKEVKQEEMGSHCWLVMEWSGSEEGRCGKGKRRLGVD